MSAPEAKYGELSYEQCIDIIDQLYNCGVMNVSITGGEALIREDFFSLLDRMLVYGINITHIYSNGALVSAELLDALDRRRIYPEFNLSYDGVGWHDWLRGVEGAEETVINAYKLCRERRFPTGAELCLHKRNRNTLRESINLLASLGVRSLKTNPASMSGDWIENEDGDNLSINELFDIYLDYIPYFFEDGSPISLQLGGFFYAYKGEKKYRLPSVKSDGDEKTGTHCVCGHARDVMYLSAEGRVLPCMSLSGLDIQKDFPLIYETGLANCLTDSVYMKLIETTVDDYIAQNPECNRCKNKYQCGAGCRASALDTGGNIMGPDKAVCTFYKGGYIERIQEAAKGYECVNRK